MTKAEATLATWSDPLKGRGGQQRRCPNLALQKCAWWRHQPLLRGQLRKPREHRRCHVGPPLSAMQQCLKRMCPTMLALPADQQELAATTQWCRRSRVRAAIWHVCCLRRMTWPRILLLGKARGSTMRTGGIGTSRSAGMAGRHRTPCSLQQVAQDLYHHSLFLARQRFRSQPLETVGHTQSEERGINQWEL